MMKATIYGVGITDADYIVQRNKVVDGRLISEWRCPYYARWTAMLARGYSKKLKSKHPSYMDCSVCDEWLVFSHFKYWMENQDWTGKQLDKDLLIPGNKIYTPDTSVFIDQKVNKFVLDHQNGRGDFMLGVNWNKRERKFVARCCNPITGKREFLGLYRNELEANLAWKKRKHDLACQLAESNFVSDDRVAQALRTRYAA